MHLSSDNLLPSIPSHPLMPSSLNQQHYETVIIGAGMAGLAAGIRLALAGKNVIILERHNASGGLNSFYSQAGRKFDVGLHAMTNYVPKGTRAPSKNYYANSASLMMPLTLAHRIVHAFTSTANSASTTSSLFSAEVARAFPKQIDGFLALAKEVRT